MLMFILGILVGAVLFLIIGSIVVTIGEKMEKKANEKIKIKRDISKMETMARINKYDINHPPEFKIFDMVRHREKANNHFKVFEMRTSSFCRYLTLYDSKNDITFTDKERLYEKEVEGEDER